jgi:preflagellin peptidase FlaK
MAWQIVLSDDVLILSIGLMPILGLLSYFLVCEWVVDFEEKIFNLPWLLILLFCFVGLILQSYWIGMTLFFSVFLGIFLLVFILLEFLVFYKDYRHYMILKDESKKESKGPVKIQKTSAGGKGKDQKKETEKKISSGKEKKSPKKISKEQTSVKDRRFENDGGSATTKKIDMHKVSSWIFMVFLVGHICISIILYNFVSGNEATQLFVGIYGAVVPIILFVLYLSFFDWSLFPENEDESSGNQTHAAVGDNDPDDQEIDFSPRHSTLGEKAGWAIIFVLGFVLIFEAITRGLDNNYPDEYMAMFSVFIWLIMFYALYNLGVPKGGADTKALMALTVLFPMYIVFEPVLIISSYYSLLESLPGLAYGLPFAFSVLLNATIISLFIPISLLIYNATRGDLQFPLCFFGYKTDLKTIKDKHVWLMDRLDDKGNVSSVLFPVSTEDEPDMVKKLKKKGISKVWVTPKIPFIIPMTIGFVFNFIFGCLIFVIMFGFYGY